MIGKVVIITGASSGIGRATARLFAENGAQIVAVGRNEEGLKSLQSDIEDFGGSVSIRIADVTIPENVSDLVHATVETFGKIDILINAAGIIANGTIENTSLNDWDSMMNTNLRSVFYLMNQCIPHLEKTKGNIVNVSSVTGVRAFPGVLAYCVSKAAVDQLTHCSALELAPKGIRVNAINPGVVQTNLHKRSGMDNERYSAFLEHSKSTHPLGRVGQPADAAELINFLASDKAAWITGVTYELDGGRAQTCAR